MKSSPIEIRDQREKEWYWTNNKFVDSYGELVGTHAVAVYSVLCRYANNDTQKCFPSMETIGIKAGIKSRKTVSKAIEILESFGIIEVEKASGADGKRLNNIYRLNSPSSWKGFETKGLNDIKLIISNLNPLENNILEKTARAISAAKVEEIDRAVYPWLNYEVWQEWVEYRKQKKQTLTVISIKKQIKFLELHKEDHVEIIIRSITNGWTGLFPLRKDYKNPSKISAPPGKYANVK